MRQYKSVHIIYNPKSTGDSKKNAFRLREVLTGSISDIPITIVPTKYASHAEELACDIALNNKNPLIVSSSGDGGYNEVINGVMKAGKKSAGAICAVLASGNANDHSRTMQNRPLEDAILEGKPKSIDLLRFTFTAPDKKVLIRYAHSYAGLGLTPVVAKEVNANTFNHWQELMLVLRVFFRYKPFRIKHAGKVRKIDNMVFSNINQMAKVFKLTKQNHPDDGRFRVLTFPHTRKRMLAVNILKALFGRIENIKVCKAFSFETVDTMPMQLDGEVIELVAGTKVTVMAASRTLQTIY